MRQSDAAGDLLLSEFPNKPQQHYRLVAGLQREKRLSDPGRELDTLVVRVVGTDDF